MEAVVQAEENKALKMSIVEGDFVIEVDPNKNGKPLIKISLDLEEAPSEVVALFKKGGK